MIKLYVYTRDDGSPFVILSENGMLVFACDFTQDRFLGFSVVGYIVSKLRIGLAESHTIHSQMFYTTYSAESGNSIMHGIYRLVSDMQYMLPYSTIKQHIVNTFFDDRRIVNILPENLNSPLGPIEWAMYDVWYQRCKIGSVTAEEATMLRDLLLKDGVLLNSSVSRSSITLLNGESYISLGYILDLITAAKL